VFASAAKSPDDVESVTGMIAGLHCNLSVRKRRLSQLPGGNKLSADALFGQRERAQPD
jgi:hypothetical protein